MKFFPIYLLLIVISCTSKVESSEEDKPAQEPVAFTEVDAVCIWDKVSVREEPKATAKWKTSISVGEKLVFLGAEAIDSVDKNRKYYNVKLADGTEGWSVADFIVPEATVGVFLAENFIYKRPDLLTKTENRFSIMDIVAIKSVQDDWVEVTGKRSEGKWIESGWVKEGNISKESLDVAVAKFGKIAFDKSDIATQVEGLKEILDNSDFARSAFIPMIQERYNELSAPVNINPEQEIDSLEVMEN